MRRSIRVALRMFHALTILCLVGFGLMIITSAVLVHRAEKTRQEHLQVLDEARVKAKAIVQKQWKVGSVSINKDDQTSRFVARILLENEQNHQMTLTIYSSCQVPDFLHS